MKKIIIAPRYHDDLDTWKEILSSDEKYKGLQEKIIFHKGEFGHLRKEYGESIKVVVGSLMFDNSDFNSEYRRFSSYTHRAIIFTSLTDNHSLDSHAVNGAIVVRKSNDNIKNLLDLFLKTDFSSEQGIRLLDNSLKKEFRMVK